MKSVLRSAFDPVPRPLSPAAQLLVVGVLVVGITISVVEYLESSKLATLVQEPVAQPALIGAQTSAQTGARAPASEAAKAPRVVRASMRSGAATSAPAGGAAAQPFPASGVDASPASAAPMTLQPDGDS
jgi:hypothetical protein